MGSIEGPAGANRIPHVSHAHHARFTSARSLTTACAHASELSPRHRGSEFWSTQRSPKVCEQAARSRQCVATKSLSAWRPETPLGSPTRSVMCLYWHRRLKRAFAVFMLMTSRKVDACWMGTSPALAARRILSTMSAADRASRRLKPYAMTLLARVSLRTAELAYGQFAGAGNGTCIVITTIGAPPVGIT